MNFQKLWENIQANKLNKSHAESKASSAIRTGIGIREDFWDDFLSVINNSEGLSELLDIPVTKISSWHSRIQEELDKVKHSDLNDTAGKDTLLKTGLGQENDSHSMSR